MLCGLAAALGLLAAGCGSSSKPGLILVLVSSEDGEYALYGISADGGDRHRLTRGKSRSSGPSHVFYEIEPAWSPDGKLIAFSSSRDGSYHIFTVTPDGKHTSRLTSTSQDDGHPTWSPDGERIAFVHGFPGEIQTMNADGTGATNVTGGQAELTDPAWSPDRRWIAYARREPGSPVRELWLVRPDGSDRHPLTSLGAISYWPTWSPDGKRLAFVSDRGGTSFDLYSIGVTGLGLRSLTSSASDDLEPAWSPDGKKIAFSTGGSIATIDLGGQKRQVLTDGPNDSMPAWNPSASSEK